MVKRVGIQLVVGSTFLVALFASARDVRSGKALNRSIYVPVRLALCEHIAEATLYQDETPVRSLPGEQTVLFTFYPDLNRLLPQEHVFHVRGKETSGLDFDLKLTVTPTDVFIGDHRVDLHPEEQTRDWSYRVDVHYHPVTLKLNCRDFCPRQTETQHTAELSR
jgi:hypothetical protein